MNEFLSYWLQRSLHELIATKVDLVMTQKKLIDANFKLIGMQQRALNEQIKRIELERQLRRTN